MFYSTRTVGSRLLLLNQRRQFVPVTSNACCRLVRHGHPTRRLLSSLDDDDSYKEAYERRHYGIQLHPDSISKNILPGNFVMRESKSGKIQRRYTELVYGYFWMIKDLTKSDDKPIQSNTTLIPEPQAKVFPDLFDLTSLAGEQVDLPDYFLRKNRSLDAAAQCTVVAVSFRDFGYNLLSSWLDPFKEAMEGKDRVEVVRLNLSEGWFNKHILRGFIQGLTKKNTPEAEHERTLLYFGGSDSLEGFRDCLRMHNVMTGYVFLLDGLGRVRFAGSGPATDEEVQRLIRFSKDLTPLLQPGTKSAGGAGLAPRAGSRGKGPSRT